MPFGPITRRQSLIAIGAICASRIGRVLAAATAEVAPQPYFANVKRAIEALAKLGTPITPEDSQRITTLALAQDESDQGFEAAEAILNRYTLACLSLRADGSVDLNFGGARRDLVEQGWRMFLVRVENKSGAASSISFSGAVGTPGQWGGSAQRASLDDTLNKAPIIEETWFLSELHETTLTPIDGWPRALVSVSGLPVEYHVIKVFSRDHGRRVVDLKLEVPQSGRIWSTWASKTKKFDFDCSPTRDIKLVLKDTDGRGCMMALTIKDSRGHVYPPQAMRLAPDMFFHDHIYRADGETVRLPDGEYMVESRRGPEYLKCEQTIRIGGDADLIDARLKRWIDPSHWDWYSGDVHIHAAGCSHYQNPTEGVSPETMIRHVRGEGLVIGEVLTWGPSWYYQKAFFTGRAESPPAALEHPQLQAANNASWQPHATAKDGESLVRYDVEVSGFPSSLSGHLILLRLKEQDYPGTKQIEDWPSWNLPILKWAKSQGAVTGYAHCAHGMVVESNDLPNFEVPPFDSIGTNEAIVDVTHGLTDFLAGCDLWPLAELNAWYHLLNCGFRLAMVGETDYPCISGERPGVGRTYVQLPQRPVDNAGYEEWIAGLQRGRLYCGDGRSHFLDFRVQGRRSGESVALSASGKVSVKALVSARLEPKSERKEDVLRTPGGKFQRWHLEDARIGDSREVPVELVVNGLVADQTTILADGMPREISFKATLARSSWVALRILPSSHVYPVFVDIDNKPIRASKRSAEWCQSCVDKLWQVKSRFIRDSERAAAAEAYDHARKTYSTIAGECEVD
jgi:hypothetical protein